MNFPRVAFAVNSFLAEQPKSTSVYTVLSLHKVDSDANPALEWYYLKTGISDQCTKYNVYSNKNSDYNIISLQDVSDRALAQILFLYYFWVSMIFLGNIVEWCLVNFSAILISELSS